MTPAITTDKLNYSFAEGGGQHQILRDLSFQISPGEFVAIVGQSGSGKSTLLHLLCGIDAPQSGTVMISGKVLTAMNETDRTLFRRKHIGLVFQFFNLIPTLTVEENLILPLELCGEPNGASRVGEVLAHIGLSDRACAFPDKLSGGEQQRVAIARAIIHKPALILADEPTGNLDAENGIKVIELLTRLVKTENATLVLVTHSHAVAQCADRVLELKQGKLQLAPGDLAW